jgi:DNA polymerase III subunit epsilon
MTKIIYIDTETTGLDREKCAITQLAGVIRVGDQEEEFNFFMAPHEGAEISEEALQTQGKTLEEVKAYPDANVQYVAFCSLLAKYVNRFDKLDKFVLLGYNVGYDADMVRALFTRNGDNYFGSWFWTPPIDVMSIAAKALVAVRTTLPNFKLETVYRFLFPNEDKIEFHDAMADIAATRRIARVLNVSVIPEKEVANAGK